MCVSGKDLGICVKRRDGRSHTYPNILGWITAFLHALERGPKEPCLNTLDILAKSFDLSISEFMKGI
jgi:hypothetical protein